MSTRRELTAYLDENRDEHPNLEGYTDDDIWAALPDQDPRHDQGEDGLRDMLNDLPYLDCDVDVLPPLQ